MIIYFSCPVTDLIRYKDNYLEIRNSIKKAGHTINRDWLDNSIELANKKEKEIPTPDSYKETMSAIITADAIICDVSVRSMALGHIVTFALQKMKPVLLIYSSNRNNQNSLFIAMSKSPLLTIKTYKTKEEIYSIVKNFIQNSEQKSKTRFNLSINKAQDSYLEWKSFTAKKSKTEIIQDSINEKMNSDTDFENYLDS